MRGSAILLLILIDFNGRHRLQNSPKNKRLPPKEKASFQNENFYFLLREKAFIEGILVNITK